MEYVSERGRPLVAGWLYIIALLILGMVILGGLTRLTGSGLSMVEWNVIMGAVPPLNAADWAETFEKYKLYPEYLQHNRGMSVDQFKFIFMMEYSHRMLGRFIGLAFFFPFVFFLLKKWLRPPMIRRCILLFILGGMQGVIGWYMVKSGLVDIPRVSQYRLTLHLSMALLALVCSLWLAFGITFRHVDSGDRQGLPQMAKAAGVMLALVAFQLMSGGFVAGLDAGHGFNHTFPKMGEDWIPAAAFAMEPAFINFFENPIMVQLVHRWSGMVVGTMVLAFAWSFHDRFQTPRLKRAIRTAGVLVTIQVLLGIATLMMMVPTPLASLHQLVAVLLLATMVFLLHQGLNCTEQHA